ncbi:MAG: DNA integrity scanning protein DisA nucleotide-binding domain protein [Deltaproteobacteria bacterium]|nr:DNA integrity scanning protein DisA nucleotide-binding domain protein [Deltaproteobacteria bacterium]MBW1961366.1 DNA integrity scanning protein DisA nucleotide-binding domain protein [Deltaproteobacteria bacterium]MBW1993305.1 DNA integrity scanning protein DisA nucleotide-binding domain protein [Deltaproteobacteria bacterium]MBW2152526.1 DNA integrity scanning protein DisA nucleotide-binding domain protein [Deltaproteobacteria bacterium]
MIQPLSLLSDVCCADREINLITLENVVLLAVEIAREGREGRKIGTLFVVSDAEEVLKRSRDLILDPLKGHPDKVKRIDDPNMRETVKELAQLDGAFIVSDEGVVISACRYINASSRGITLPLGFGTRHMAAASITKATNAVAVVVSESSVVRLFDNGELVSEIIPELWFLTNYHHHLTGRYTEKREHELTVVSKKN